MLKNLWEKNYNTNWDDWNIEENEEHSMNVEIKLIFGILLYVIFLLIGILGTTFFEGKPQILSFELIEKRKSYRELIAYLEKTKKFPNVTITDLNNLDQSNIIEKLTTLDKQNDILQEQLVDLQKNKYKLSKNNEELYNLVYSYLLNKKQLIERIINYYKDPQTYGKGTINKQYNAFKGYEREIFRRIGKIKKYDLLYERRDIIDDIIQQL